MFNSNNSKSGKQTIKCDVSTCKYYNCDECTLNEIKVGSCCENPSVKDETICDSYKEKK